jgi:hypothetical protein
MSKKSDTDISQVITDDTQNNKDEGDEMEIDICNTEQLNYDCFVNLEQYAWDSDTEW